MSAEWIEESYASMGSLRYILLEEPRDLLFSASLPDVDLTLSVVLAFKCSELLDPLRIGVHEHVATEGICDFKSAPRTSNDNLSFLRGLILVEE